MTTGERQEAGGQKAGGKKARGTKPLALVIDYLFYLLSSVYIHDS